MLQAILKAYAIDPELHQIKPFGSGLINHTWLITGPGQQYILQRINTNVFKDPAAIAGNLQLLAAYLKTQAPDYIFAAPLPAADGRYMVNFNGEYFRLSPFVANSHTVDFLTDAGQAYQAARQFAKFTNLLSDFDIAGLKETLPNFHNLNLRLTQFEQALIDAKPEKKTEAGAEIAQVETLRYIANQYNELINSGQIPLRVIHHDTKINNVLFNDANQGLGVIDLDTVMPGYYISDVGDMMRTYLAEASEEETDLTKITIRDDFFAAIYSGYMQQMGNTLTGYEKRLFIYAGELMIYMQAIRFLTDFLNDDVYYGSRYPGHNLARAKNQFYLLSHYIAAKPKFTAIITQFEKQAVPTA